MVLLPTNVLVRVEVPRERRRAAARITDPGQDQRGREPRQRARPRKDGEGGKGQESGGGAASDPGDRPPAEGEVHVAIPRHNCAVQQIWFRRDGIYSVRVRTRKTAGESILVAAAFRRSKVFG